MGADFGPVEPSACFAAKRLQYVPKHEPQQYQPGRKAKDTDDDGYPVSDYVGKSDRIMIMLF